ncbi:MAG: hypothetical protein EBR93_05000 [Bacteroidetes bacterium]|nr:hypothetical protein [Bacteroidota bacterium]
MTHHCVTLSNGEMLTIEEGEERLTLAHWDSDGFRTPIAFLNRNGVLGYSHYDGFATESLVRGLQECTV